MSGPNFILDKGYPVDAAATNVAYGRFCKFADAAGKTVTTSGVSADGPVDTELIVGVYQDTVDADKVATGKHHINVRMIGISRVVAGAAVTVGDRITSDAQGRGIPAAPGAAASIWAPGVALSPAALAGDHFNCLVITGGVAVDVGT